MTAILKGCFSSRPFGYDQTVAKACSIYKVTLDCITSGALQIPQSPSALFLESHIHSSRSLLISLVQAGISHWQVYLVCLSDYIIGTMAECGSVSQPGSAWGLPFAGRLDGCGSPDNRLCRARRPVQAIRAPEGLVVTLFSPSLTSRGPEDRLVPPITMLVDSIFVQF